MKNFLTIFLLLLIPGMVLVNSCSSSRKTQESEKESTVNPEDTILFASIHRTACYGRCPNYTATIYQSGYAVYEGIQFTEKIGKYTAMVSKEEMELLLDEAKAIDYFSLEDRYDSHVTDVPSCTTTIHAEGKRKSVFYRHEGPLSLKDFQKKFDKILDAQQWTKAEQEAPKE